MDSVKYIGMDVYSRAMDGAAKIVTQRKIFRSITSARAASWGKTSKRISLHSSRTVTKPHIFIADRDRDSGKTALCFSHLVASQGFSCWTSGSISSIA